MTAAERIRAKLLDLAIRGKLVPQDMNDEPADVLLSKIRDEKERLLKEKKIKKEKPLPPITDEEKPFVLPKGWVWCRLGELCTQFQYGTARKSASVGDVPVLRMGNLREGEIDYTDLVFTSDKDDIRQYSLNNGDLLFNRTNSSEKVGKVAIFRGNKPCVFAGYLVRFKPILCSPEYINYLMNSYYQWDFCQSVKSDAVNQSNISASKFILFPIPLPPIAEQKRIVEKLEELLKAADTLGKCVEKFDELSDKVRAKILDLAVRGKLVPQDANDEPADVLLSKIREEKARLLKEKKIKKEKPLQPIADEEKAFDLPKGWAWCRLGEICEILDALRKPVTKGDRESGPYPYYGATCIQDYVADYIFDEPLVLLGEDGAKWDAGANSAFCINGKTWVNNHAHVLRPLGEIDHLYLANALCSLDLRDYITGTTVPKLNQERMREILIPLPPLAEQKRIVANVESTLAACERLKGMGA